LRAGVVSNVDNGFLERTKQRAVLLDLLANLPRLENVDFS